jgi:hypothetical protein
MGRQWQRSDWSEEEVEKTLKAEVEDVKAPHTSKGS